MHCDLYLGDIPCFKVMTHPWVMDNNFVKYFQDPISQELWSGYLFWVCVYCDLDFGDMTVCQGHDTPLGGQQLFFKHGSEELLPRH